jgi:hypothetical protein
LIQHTTYLKDRIDFLGFELVGPKEAKAPVNFDYGKALFGRLQELEHIFHDHRF